MSRQGLRRESIISRPLPLWLLIAMASAFLCACSPSDESATTAASQEKPRVRNVPDPAMESPPETAVGKPVKIDRLPGEVALDETGERIFIPQMGWLPLHEFWELYQNQPERLPDDLDLEAVHEIRLSLAEQDHDQS